MMGRQRQARFLFPRTVSGGAASIMMGGRASTSEGETSTNSESVEENRGKKSLRWSFRGHSFVDHHRCSNGRL